MRPRALDLYCGGGGMARGLHAAGYEVVGVDNRPQPDYPYEFHLADAMDYPLGGFDLVHASPPCQDHSQSAHLGGWDAHGTGWMLAATIDRLSTLDVPWTVENVSGARAAMGGYWFVLCGSMFGLGVLRHRYFASSELMLTPSCDHALVPAPLAVYGHSEDNRTCERYRAVYGHRPGLQDRRAAMGLPSMSRAALSQAVPPAYGEWIGYQILGSKVVDV